MSFMEQYFSELVIDHAHQLIPEDFDLSLNRSHSFGPTHPKLVKKFLTQVALPNGLALASDLKLKQELQKTLKLLHKKDFYVSTFNSVKEVSAYLPEAINWKISSLIHIQSLNLVDTNCSYPQIIDLPGYMAVVVSESELPSAPISWGMTLLDDCLSFFFSYDLWRTEGKIHKLSENVKEALAELSVEKLEVSGLVFKIKDPGNDLLQEKLKNNGFQVSKLEDILVLSIPLTWPTTVFEQWRRAIKKD